MCAVNAAILVVDLAIITVFIFGPLAREFLNFIFKLLLLLLLSFLSFSLMLLFRSMASHLRMSLAFVPTHQGQTSSSKLKGATI
jgi:hypothetical protein